MKLDPSIEFLELYAVAVSILLWIKNFKNSRVALFCDNESVVWMINRQSSRCPNCMTLIRVIVLECLIHNVRFYAKHVRTHLNSRADALSRNRINLFKQLSFDLGIDLDPHPSRIPEILTGMEKIWIA